MTDLEQKEVEPKQVIFEILIHLKEKTKVNFLEDLVDNLEQEQKYTSTSVRTDAKLPPLNLKGGKSFNVMSRLAEARGIACVGMKWRDDVEPQRDGSIDNGVAVVLQFGTGKTDFGDKVTSDKWKVLCQKVFQDYVWNVDYHKGENKFGLFGPTEVIVRTDGSSVADDPGNQMVLADVQVSAGENGMIYSWKGVKVELSYE